MSFSIACKITTVAQEHNQRTSNSMKPICPNDLPKYIPARGILGGLECNIIWVFLLALREHQNLRPDRNFHSHGSNNVHEINRAFVWTNVAYSTFYGPGESQARYSYRWVVEICIGSIRVRRKTYCGRLWVEKHGLDLLIRIANVAQEEHIVFCSGIINQTRVHGFQRVYMPGTNIKRVSGLHRPTRENQVIARVSCIRCKRKQDRSISYFGL